MSGDGVYYAEDGTASIVLDDNYDSNYEPSEQEVHEYAGWLGMDLEEDKELLWIAREGLKTPLPTDWKACKTVAGDLYYFNFVTGESLWDHPMDKHYKDKFEEEKRGRKASKLGAHHGTLEPLPHTPIVGVKELKSAKRAQYTAQLSPITSSTSPSAPLPTTTTTPTSTTATTSTSVKTTPQTTNSKPTNCTHKPTELEDLTENFNKQITDLQTVHEEKLQYLKEAHTTALQQIVQQCATKQNEGASSAISMGSAKILIPVFLMGVVVGASFVTFVKRKDA